MVSWADVIVREGWVLLVVVTGNDGDLGCVDDSASSSPVDSLFSVFSLLLLVIPMVLVREAMPVVGDGGEDDDDEAFSRCLLSLTRVSSTADVRDDSEAVVVAFAVGAAGFCFDGV